MTKTQTKSTQQEGFKTRQEVAAVYKTTTKTLRNWLKKQPLYKDSVVEYADKARTMYSPACMKLIMDWLDTPELSPPTPKGGVFTPPSGAGGLSGAAEVCEVCKRVVG